METSFEVLVNSTLEPFKEDSGGVGEGGGVFTMIIWFGVVP